MLPNHTNMPPIAILWVYRLKLPFFTMNLKATPQAALLARPCKGPKCKARIGHPKSFKPIFFWKCLIDIELLIMRLSKNLKFGVNTVVNK